MSDLTAARIRARALCVALFSLALWGCEEEAEPVGFPSTDTGTSDTGGADAGAGEDAGSGEDAGTDVGGDTGGGDTGGGDTGGGDTGGGDTGGGDTGGGDTGSDPCADVPFAERCDPTTFGAATCEGEATVLSCRAIEGSCGQLERTTCPDAERCDESAGAAACADFGWPAGVTIISLDRSGAGRTSANFADGEAMEDLSWASEPDIACWDNPRTTDEFFSQHHLSFALETPIPAWSDVTIRLTPADNAEANLYVLQQNAERPAVPPAIEGARYCPMPETFGSPGEPTDFTFRVYEETAIFFGVANRGRFPGDDETNVDVEVQVTPVSETERCYADAGQPGQHPPHVQRVTLDDEGSWVGVDTLDTGAPVCGDLDYLDSAFCVPETQLDRFSGNQKLYAIDGGIPEGSVVTVTVTPDPGVDVSLYGTQQGAGTGFAIPPRLTATLCESSLRYSGDNPGEPETISFVSTTNAYEIFFAVAGTSVQGASGGYTVSIGLQTAPGDACSDEDYEAARGLEDWPRDVRTLDASGGSVSVDLNTREGAPLCGWSWAWSSQTACFPATELVNFEGSTQLFALDPPPRAGSSVVARLVPQPGVDVSLAGWMVGADRYVVPPFVPSVVSCEASYARGIGDVTNPGVSEEIGFYNPAEGNPYQYVFAVSGPADEALAGEATLEIEVFEPPPAHCPESLPGATYPAFPSTVQRVDLLPVDESTSTGSVSGDLSEGRCTNLDFADRSSVACYPETRFELFTGNHVQYALSEPMPPRSELTITLTPETGVDVNLYGMQIGTTNFPVPPNVSSVAVCEASYPISVGPTLNPGETEQIFFSNPTDNEYNITFLAAGPQELAEGAYRIDLELREAVTHCPESLEDSWPDDRWADDVATFSIDAETGVGSFVGDIGDGTCTNLDFAADSGVACFPATRNEHFEGSHSYVALSEPMPPDSILTVTLLPEPGADLNLYGFQVGSETYLHPPTVPSAIACEASYGPAYVPGIVGDPSNPGGPESIRFLNPTGNEYNILLGVAGPRGVSAGGYEILATLETGETHCEESLPGAAYERWPANVEIIELSDGAGSARGNLRDGSCVNLDWADDSANACFPQPLFEGFQGNHRFHAIEGVPAAGSTVEVRLEGDNMQLYGYQVGAGRFPVPPYVASVVLCDYVEGEGSITFRNPGDNPYQVFVGVAGRDGIDSGNYVLSVTTE